jgi:thiol-disulfide isomerase/thioredoxin
MRQRDPVLVPVLLDEPVLGGPRVPEGIEAEAPKMVAPGFEWVPVGTAVPPFELPDLTGTTKTLEDFRGQQVFLVNWSLTCGFCSRIAPEIAKLQPKLPYGYHLVDAGPHPAPAKAAQGIRLDVLEPDPLTAPVVVRIFRAYVSGKGLYAIAEELARDGVPSPAAYDRRRNPHRSGEAWSKSAVRAILLNPRYTGISVWGRQRREEVLLDVEDVAAGHRTKMVWNDPSAWVRSAGATHEPLISRQLFAQAQALGCQSRRVGPSQTSCCPSLLRPSPADSLRPVPAAHAGELEQRPALLPVPLPVRVRPGHRVEHPKTVYVRQADVVPALDRWLATVFDPKHLEQTCEALAAAQAATVTDETRLAAARRTLAECDEKLGRYRAALEAGTDPAIVAGWIREVTELRRRAERETRAATVPAVSVVELRALVEELGDLVRVLEQADPAKKAELYESLGLNLVYHAEDRRVTVEADLDMCRVRVGGGVWFHDIGDRCLATSFTPRFEGVGDVVGSARGGRGQDGRADQVRGGPGLRAFQAVGPRADQAVRSRRRRGSRASVEATAEEPSADTG